MLGVLTAEGAPAVGAVWQRLGLDGWFAQVGAARGVKALERAVFAMVANRLVAAPHKARTLTAIGADTRTWDKATIT